VNTYSTCRAATASATVKRSLRRWPFCSFVDSFLGVFLSCVSACDLLRVDVFLWRSHKNANSVFRLGNPVHGVNTLIFKVDVFTEQAKYA